MEEKLSRSYKPILEPLKTISQALVEKRKTKEKSMAMSTDIKKKKHEEEEVMDKELVNFSNKHNIGVGSPRFLETVSYTHLDVYKRQLHAFLPACLTFFQCFD